MLQRPLGIWVQTACEMLIFFFRQAQTEPPDWLTRSTLLQIPRIVILDSDGTQEQARQRVKGGEFGSADMSRQSNGSTIEGDTIRGGRIATWIGAVSTVALALLTLFYLIEVRGQRGIVKEQLDEIRTQRELTYQQLRIAGEPKLEIAVDPIEMGDPLRIRTLIRNYGGRAENIEWTVAYLCCGPADALAEMALEQLNWHVFGSRFESLAGGRVIDHRQAFSTQSAEGRAVLSWLLPAAEETRSVQLHQVVTGEYDTLPLTEGDQVMRVSFLSVLSWHPLGLQWSYPQEADRQSVLKVLLAKAVHEDHEILLRVLDGARSTAESLD